MTENWSFDTLQIHAGQVPDPVTGARALPIYQTTAFVFDDADQAAARFNLTDAGPIYTRLTNPTTEVVEKRIAALEGGVGALLLASGQAATTLAILNLGGAGSHVVSTAAIYGGTFNLFRHTFAKLGIDVTFVKDTNNLEEWRAAVRPNTIAFFGETIANPGADILDIEGVAAVAHDAGVPLIIDNTVATPYLIRPFEWGADIVVHSVTKYLGGHGTSMGGAIVDAGTFDYGAYPDRFPQFNEPDESYHGLTYAKDLGGDGTPGTNLSYILKARVQGLRDLGSSIAPLNSFLISLGIETLSLRVQRHADTALALAQWLETRDEVESVAYAGLPSSPHHELATKYAPKGAGGILAFTLKGGLEAGKSFVDALELHSFVANLGDVRSLVIHPASTTHAQLSEDEQLAAGVNPGLIRLSPGLEDITDIRADLEKGFAAITGPTTA